MRAGGLSGVAPQIGDDENRGRGNEKCDEGKAQVASHGHLQRAIKRQSELVGRGNVDERPKCYRACPLLYRGRVGLCGEQSETGGSGLAGGRPALSAA